MSFPHTVIHGKAVTFNNASDYRANELLGL